MNEFKIDKNPKLTEEYPCLVLDDLSVGCTLHDMYIKPDGIKTINVVSAFDVTDPDMDGKMHGKYIAGKGYIDLGTGNVWIYSEKEPDTLTNDYPYFWFDENGICFSHGISDHMKELMTIDNVRCMSVSKMTEYVSEETRVHNERIDELLSVGSSMVLPIVKPSDDGLKKMVKSELRDCRISLSGLPIVDKGHQTANMSSALKNGTKMSVPYFHLWRETLKRDAFIITANIDPQDGYHALVYTDSRDMIGHISDEDFETFMDILSRAVDDEHVKSLAMINPDDEKDMPATEIISTGEEDDDEYPDE